MKNLRRSVRKWTILSVRPFVRSFGPELHWVKNSSHVSIAPHVTINAIISLPSLTKVACEEDGEANFQGRGLPKNNMPLSII